jgi:hypothetical protein
LAVTESLRLRVPASLAYAGVLLALGGSTGVIVGIAAHSVASVGFGILVVVFATRIFLVRLIANERGVSMRNVWRSRSLGWSEITGMEVEEAPGFWPGQVGPSVRRRIAFTTAGGKRCRATATTSIPMFGHPPTDRWHEELDRRWRATRFGTT